MSHPNEPQGHVAEKTPIDPLADAINYFELDELTLLRLVVRRNLPTYSAFELALTLSLDDIKVKEATLKDNVFTNTPIHQEGTIVGLEEFVKNVTGARKLIHRKLEEKAGDYKAEAEEVAVAHDDMLDMVKEAREFVLTGDIDSGLGDDFEYAPQVGAAVAGLTQQVAMMDISEKDAECEKDMDVEETSVSSDLFTCTSYLKRLQIHSKDSDKDAA